MLEFCGAAERSSTPALPDEAKVPQPTLTGDVLRYKVEPEKAPPPPQELTPLKLYDKAARESGEPDEVAQRAWVPQMSMTGEILRQRVEPPPAPFSDEDVESDVSMDIPSTADMGDFGAEDGESEKGDEADPREDPERETRDGPESVPSPSQGADVWAEAAARATAEAAGRLEEQKEQAAVDDLELVLREVSNEFRPDVFWQNQYAGDETEQAAFSVGERGTEGTPTYFTYFAYPFWKVLGGGVREGPSRPSWPPPARDFPGGQAKNGEAR
jgi:hypothetical protein